MIYKINIRNSWHALLIFVVLSFALYLPTINRSFVSDDFLVIRRVGLDKILLVQGFFRPLSDLTLYFNYLIGGFNPVGYNIFGILLHGINCFLLFNFCKQWKWTDNETLQRRYALFAALLFLCYPFHNESIVWTLGRASSMANAFGILSLLIITSTMNEKLKIFFVCACFFVGLTSYESIMILPFMVLVILYRGKSSWHRLFTWTFALTVTFVLHLIARIKISGVLLGSYGEGFFTVTKFHYFTNIFKVTARLFLPPIERSVIFAIAAGILIVLLIMSSVFTWRRTTNKQYFIKIIALISIASAVSILFSVSTKTSESDRFLHFPSFFVCCFTSFVLVNLIAQLNKFWLAAIIICLYFIFYLEKNNANWIKASNMTENIISAIKENRNHQKLFIVNLPDEYKGAYVFRLGLKDALLINKIDTTNIVVVNNIRGEQMRRFSTIIVPIKHGSETTIPPDVTINESSLQKEFHREGYPTIIGSPGNDTEVLYWNNQELMKLN